MKISDIRIRLVTTAGILKAVASVTIEDSFVIHDIKILESANGLFIAMPNRKNAKGEYKDICHPLNTPTRETLKTALLDEYERVLAEEKNGAQKTENDLSAL